ncbi:hypothetical protein [Paenibacillus sp. R14(2021)]|uniref:hypothetical protein n=1 Tax=Paenibacillus sp. R14(2021) TaxID=2859228 RepID=UPI001C614074|nr:hypothetical protein [Paenibacillus sp. R14(2021)]
MTWVLNAYHFYVTEMLNISSSGQRSDLIELDILPMEAHAHRGLLVDLDKLGDTAAIAKTGVPINDSSWTWKDFMDVEQQLREKGEFKQH